MTDSEYLLSLLDETFAAVPQIKAHHERMRQIAARLATHPLAAAVLQQEAGEPVGVAGAMPGTSGFTMACFKAADVPVGTKLYATPPLPQRQEAAQVEDHAFGRGPWAPKVYGVAPYPGAPVLMVNLPAPITQAVADIDETMRLADAYARESGKNNEYDNEYQADAAREALRSHLAKDRT